MANGDAHHLAEHRLVAVPADAGARLIVGDHRLVEGLGLGALRNAAALSRKGSRKSGIGSLAPARRWP